MKQLSFVAVVAVMVLTACPPTGVVCKPGTVPCGIGCIDPSSDRRNCGACGTTCGAQQDCNAKVGVDGGPSGECKCGPGTTLCEGSCVVTDYDAKNCGACGVACAVGQVCELATCKASCGTGFTRCGASCVDVTGDLSNCGACGVTCEQGQACRAGVCDYAAVAACYWSGQLVGFDPTSGVKGPLADVGTNPAALARVGDTVLVADGTDRRLYSAVPAAGGSYAQTNRVTPTGAVPNQMLVDRPFVYVVNAGAGTLLVLKEGVDAGVVTLDAGVEGALVLGAVAELQLGMNSFPQGVAKVGSMLFVPLYGGYGAEAADAGQVLAKVDVTNPAAPSLAGQVSFKTLDLHAFDGGAPVARPWAVTAKGGSVYVALNNLNPDSYVPEGPGLVAKVNPTTDAVTVIDLGGAECLNPQWLAASGDKLVVSCGGAISYSPTFSVQGVTSAGVVVLDAQDARLGGAWNASGVADVDAGFMPTLPGRFSVSGSQVTVGDQNGGRVVVLTVSDAGVAVSSTLNVCPVSATSGVANVADISTR